MNDPFERIRSRVLRSNVNEATLQTTTECGQALVTDPSDYLSARQLKIVEEVEAVQPMKERLSVTRARMEGSVAQGPSQHSPADLLVPLACDTVAWCEGFGRAGLRGIRRSRDKDGTACSLEASMWHILNERKLG